MTQAKAGVEVGPIRHGVNGLLDGASNGFRLGEPIVACGVAGASAIVNGISQYGREGETFFA